MIVNLIYSYIHMIRKNQIDVIIENKWIRLLICIMLNQMHTPMSLLLNYLMLILKHPIYLKLWIRLPLKRILIKMTLLYQARHSPVSFSPNAFTSCACIGSTWLVAYSRRNSNTLNIKVFIIPQLFINLSTTLCYKNIHIYLVLVSSICYINV